MGRSQAAISTTLLLGAVFRLPLRRTEGFVRSIVDLMGRDLPVPDHTTLSRRRRTVDVVPETGTNKRPTDIVLDSTGLKFFCAGESRAKYGETRRSWHKLYISVDPAGSEIRAHELTGDDTADATMSGPMAAGSGGMIRRVFAGGAYDGEPVAKAIREARPPNSPPEIIVPPRATSIPPPDMADRNGSCMRRRSRQGAQRRQADRSHIPIPTKRNRHSDRRTQSFHPSSEAKHHQDPLTNRPWEITTSWLYAPKPSACGGRRRGRSRGCRRRSAKRLRAVRTRRISGPGRVGTARPGPWARRRAALPD